MWGAYPWLFAAVYFPALQLLPLCLFARRPRSETIVPRMAATALAACGGGWVPTARRLADLQGMGIAPPSLAAALGLRLPGLAAACVLPLALTALLFAGPLLALLDSWRQHRRQHGPCAAVNAARQIHVAFAADGTLWQQRVSGLPVAARIRNWVAAPVLEELLFRGCLVSYLLASGARPARCVLLCPLLFAACHLHHLHDLTRFQHFTLGTAARHVAFQFAYTWLFGVLATLYFVRTRHLAAAVLPHALCNVLGPPALPQEGAPHRRVAMAALAGGVVAFLCLVRPLTDPSLFENPPML